MARPRKKLQKADINRNSSVQVSHTIRKIKENEKKYTVILVILFMFLFIFIGYNSLRIDSTDLSQDIKSIREEKNVTIYSENVVLSSDSIMDDYNGLRNTSHFVTIKNNTNKELKYKLIFIKENINDIDCDCKGTYEFKDIRYSIDNSLVKSDLFETNGVMKIDKLDKYSSKKIEIKMWIDENFDKKLDYHLHGYFIIKEVK